MGSPRPGTPTKSHGLPCFALSGGLGRKSGQQQTIGTSGPFDDVAKSAVVSCPPPGPVQDTRPLQMRAWASLRSPKQNPKHKQTIRLCKLLPLGPKLSQPTPGPKTLCIGPKPQQMRALGASALPAWGAKPKPQAQSNQRDVQGFCPYVKTPVAHPRSQNTAQRPQASTNEGLRSLCTPPGVQNQSPKHKQTTGTCEAFAPRAKLPLPTPGPKTPAEAPSLSK